MFNMLQTPNSARRDLLLPDFFEGRSSAWGMFEDVFGNTKRTFTVDIEGKWENEVFVLDEEFLFSDGVSDRRIWRLRYREDGSFSAECPDTVAPAEGERVHDGCVLAYRFRLVVGDRTIVVKFNDTFKLIDKNTMLNRAKVSKWGLPIGQVFVAFRRGQRARSS